MQAALNTTAEVSSEPWYSQPLSIIVFGASGDLAKKKTYPSLLELFLDGYLPASTIVCGYARSKMSNEDLRRQLRPFLKKKAEEAGVLKGEELVDEFLTKHCMYKHGPYDSVDSMAAMGSELSKLHGAGDGLENRLFYLALPPGAFVTTAETITVSGIASGKGFNRVVVEKPFGRDTESAEELGLELSKRFTEEQLYRIDHYLGKEMVQNMLILRFGNTFLEPILNRNFVKSVVISFKEDIGTMGRGGYFDTSGIIRDVMQNHLMQVLSIIAMEPPLKVRGADSSNFIRDEKVKVLNCIEPWGLSNTVVGQYVTDGVEPGYLEDETVPKGSKCATYACVVMNINNPRWDGVPFIMKAGKGLDGRRAEVRIQLQNPAGAAFMFASEGLPHNELVIRLQPEEAIYMKTNVKKPGLHTSVIQSELDLTYHSRYKNIRTPDAYTRLLLDVIRGKQATFVRDDELLSAWRIVSPLLKQLEEEDVTPFPYKFGTRGPVQADELVGNAGYVFHPEYASTWSDSKL